VPFKQHLAISYYVMWNVVPLKQHLAVSYYKSEVGLYIHKPESNVDQAYVLKVHLTFFLSVGCNSFMYVHCWNYNSILMQFYQLVVTSRCLFM
jgi:hypothetical protein